MQTIIRTGTAQEQIEAAEKNLDRLGGDASDSMRVQLKFYFQARIETANAMNLQRIADSLEQLLDLIKAQPAIVTYDPDTCSCGAGQEASPPDHVETCPCWAPF